MCRDASLVYRDAGLVYRDAGLVCRDASLVEKEKNRILPLPGLTLGQYIVYMLGC